MNAVVTRYFIEVDGFIFLEPHPGPREFAFRAALHHGSGAAQIRVIEIEGEDLFSETARRSIYTFDSRERRWRPDKA